MRQKTNQKNPSLMVGVSGVRGIVGESLTPEVLTRFACAFGTYLHRGRVVIGRDTRSTGTMVQPLVTSCLLATGCVVIDIGICPTPTCQVMVEHLKADGGVIISASHNPVEWNALKFFGSDGIYLNADEGTSLLKIYDQGPLSFASWDQVPSSEVNSHALDIHMEMVLSGIDIESIRKKKFKVALDGCNGAGSVITPRLLESLGCDVELLWCDPNGTFPRDPEPIKENLSELASFVKRTRSDIGFAQDADADRLAMVSEEGVILGEEYSLAMITEWLLSQTPGKIVANLSTSRMLDDLAKKYQGELIRTKVGEVNVARKIQETRAVIGGEGNGGIIDPKFHLGRDSLVGIVRMLEYMAHENKRVSQLAARLEKYYMTKLKTNVSPDGYAKVIDFFQKKYKMEKISLLDGIRVDWEDSWIHVRPSGTEPIVRIIAEAKDSRRVDALCEEALNMLA